MNLITTPSASSRRLHERSFVRYAAILDETIAHRVLPGADGGVALVGIHGLGSDHTELLDLAAATGLGAVLLDLPGFGASARPDRAYPVSRAVDAVLGLLDHLGVARPLWLGCSYGGHVALRAALDRPDRVAALALVSSGGLDPSPPAGLAAAYRYAALVSRSDAEVALACRALAVQQNEATARFAARRLAAHRAARRGRPAREHDYHAIARSVKGALADDAAARLREVACPVTLVHGAHDVLVPIAVARAAADRLPHGRLVALAGCGHVPWLEAPQDVASCVRRAACSVSNPHGPVCRKKEDR